jgi:hypothetical protein
MVRACGDFACFVGWRNKVMQRPLIGADVVTLWMCGQSFPHQEFNWQKSEKPADIAEARTCSSGGVS